MKEYKLNTGFDENLIISNVLRFEEDVKCGNKYNTEFNIQVFSNGYSGKSIFIVDVEDWKEFILQLNTINTTLKGIAIIKDLSLGSYIEFEINRLGKVIVTGVLFDNHKEQSLKFRFEVDQTHLNNLSNELSNEQFS